MNNLAKNFEAIRNSQQHGFIPFIQAGDPDNETTLQILRVLAEFDPVAIELGVPFSDPVADGPIIQRASQRALLNNNTAVSDVLNIAAEFRKNSQTPIVLFGYLNPFLNFGLEKLASECADIGIEAVLITDIVNEEFQTLSELLFTKRIELISLVAPTTNQLRLRKICAHARGFIYAIAKKGVTGKDSNGVEDARSLVENIRAETELPVAVGFGISNSDDFKNVSEYADAAVVGSAIVSVVETSGKQDVEENVRSFVTQLLA
ncbi:MAG: tryptophan synthase subunit alpha [Pyrinomonadaceae bacterium]